MPFDYIPRDEIEAYALRHGRWIVGVLDTSIYWPTKYTLVDYERCRFLLMPSQLFTEGRHSQPAIGIEAESQGLSAEDARVRILEFASALSWQDGLQLEVVGWSGGNLPRPVGRTPMRMVSEDFELRTLPVGATDAAKTAMAFYREAVSTSNPFYSYLSFYKAFSVAVDKRSRGTWIDGALNNLSGRAAVARREVHLRDGTNVSEQLYDRNRHSIAHADKEPFVNPDRDLDRQQIALDLPIMRELAERAIAQNLGIEQSTAAYTRHAYEVAGFAQRIPAHALASLKAGKGIEGHVSIDMPDELAFVARRGETIVILQPIGSFGVEADASGLTLVGESPSDAAQLRVRIDFADDRLTFDPLQDLKLRKRLETRRHALDAVEALRLQECLFRNGRFEVWDAGGTVKLGESGPYLPFNCRIDFNAVEAEIAKFETLAATLD